MNSEIKQAILSYYKKRFGGKKFVPGKDIIPASGKLFDYKEMLAMTEAVLDGWWTEGRFAATFEKKFAKFINVPICVTTTSGSSANLLAIAALTSHHLGKRRLKPEDEVITVAAGFPTTVNPLIQYKLIPVFVDVEMGTYNINSNAFEKSITKRTKAVFLPHNIGNPFNVDAVRAVCRKRGLWLIEDCCDALGSMYRGRQVGSFGDLATFSFYAGHHMTMGEGGAVVARDNKLGSIIRSFRDWGREYWFRTGEDVRKDKGLGSRKHSALPADYDHKFLFSEIGYNLKITDMQAAIGLVQLSKLKQFTKRRHENFAFLHHAMAPYKKWIELPVAEQHADPSWFGYALTVREEAPFTRRDIINHLHGRSIGTRMFLAGNVTRQPYFQTYSIKYRVGYGGLSNTDCIAEQTFWIGMYHGIDKKQIAYMVQALKDFFSSYDR
jgi:CDP-4-dehydro-6-deoxyglucose reductase, E1